MHIVVAPAVDWVTYSVWPGLKRVLGFDSLPMRHGGRWDYGEFFSPRESCGVRQVSGPLSLPAPHGLAVGGTLDVFLLPYYCCVASGRVLCVYRPACSAAEGIFP